METSFIKVKGRKRTTVLDIPVDIFSEDDLDTIIQSMLENGKTNQIVFLSTSGILRARRNHDFGQCIRNASLIVPISNGIVRGAKFLKHADPNRFIPFDFVIRLLGVLEDQKGSLFLLGHRQQQLQTVESNLKASFPGLRIVGRYVGFFPREAQDNIITAIKKAAPSLLLVGKGPKGRNLWLFEKKKEFNPGITLWCGDCFDIISGKKPRPSRALWNRGLEFLPLLVRRPWRLFRIVLYWYYWILIILYRIGKR
ncbi:MAG: WecB/TagA/CpsF family glycosyltransferase [Spirochaetia bacterium]